MINSLIYGIKKDFENNLKTFITCYVIDELFEIEDDGLPIPEEAVQNIWEGFYRVDKFHNREAGRFGLGLFAVKTIIEKYDGTVRVLNTQKGVLF